MIEAVQEKMMPAHEQLKRERTYWLAKLSGELAKSNFPYDYLRNDAGAAQFDTVAAVIPEKVAGVIPEKVAGVIPEKVAAKILKISSGSDQRLFMLLTAGLMILLGKFSGNEDIIIGAPIYRQESKTDLLNTVLALRQRLNWDASFKELLLQVRQTVIEANEHPNYPFDQLLQSLDVAPENGRLVIFDVMNLLTNIHDPNHIENTGCNLIFTAERTGGQIGITLAYNPVNYRRRTIETIITHYGILLAQVSDNIEIKLAEIGMLSPEQQQWIIYQWNDTKAEYPDTQTIIELFEAQVRRTPLRTALVCENQNLTYRELNQRANQAAGRLRQNGVKADVIVGLLAERSLEMMVALLGILKAGGAYLPIDPEYPPERIRYMMEDSKIQLLLTNCPEKTAGFTGKIYCLDDPALYHEDNSNPERISHPEDLAYIIYTSGSTGKPKGVMIEQRGLVNYIRWAQKKYLGDERLDFPLYSSISFDLTVTSIFTPLITGNRVVIYPDHYKTRLMERIITDNQVGIVKLTPTHLKLLLNLNFTTSGIKKFIVGGEDLKVELARAVDRKFNGNIEIYNEYGPTETVVGCMIYRFDRENDRRISVPIGVPADNTQIYLLDQYLKPVPEGVSGEIYIGGAGVARGYIRQPELTLQKFVANPFIPGTYMYKTQDLARRLPDGNIEFIGRNDNQVKIRGYRIELGEVESRILKYPRVKEAVVLAKEETAAAAESSSYLAAYLVTDPELQIPELKGFLLEKLPDYMVPSYFITLERLPLTQNGKIDFKALPAPESVAGGAVLEAPADETEAKLVTIWREILGIEKIGVTDDFFNLGGHSLKVTFLLNRIHKEFNVEVPMNEVFKAPTVRKIANFIKKASANIYVSLQPVEPREYYPVSAAQKRLFIIHQFEGIGTAYNTPGALLVEGGLNRETLERVFQTLIQRHESLRTSFFTADGEIWQRVHPEVDFHIQFLDHHLPYREDQIPAIMASFIQPFDLGRAPLIRVGLASFSTTKHLIVYDLHHIISDGTSEAILVSEFTRLYLGGQLPELKIQYKDYAQWQNQLWNSSRLLVQKDYWSRQFSGEIPVLDLPADFPRSSQQSFAGGRLYFGLDLEKARQLEALALNTGSTLYMVLLAAYNALLFKYTGKEDIVVGSPIAGRPHADLEKVFGMFVNTLAMRNQPAGSKTFAAFLAEVKDKSLQAFENQLYQFDELLDQLQINRDLSRNPLFDTMFSVQNMDIQEIAIAGLKFKPVEFEFNIAKLDLTMTVVRENEGTIKFGLEYCAKLFKRATMERFAGHFLKLLAEIIANPQGELASLDLLTEEEHRRILVDFNDTRTSYPRNLSLPELFEEQAARYPDQIAVRMHDQYLTYQELNDKANRLARVLRAKGVKANEMVGILADRSLEMIISILGILKAGGAYLPIELDYPTDRVNFMLQDSGAGILLTQSALRRDGLLASLAVIDLDSPDWNSGDGSNLPKVNRSSDLAYMMYTSGSTGKPKGSLINHFNISRVVKNTNYLAITPRDVILQLSNYAFDGSTFDIFGALLNGAALVLIAKEEVLDLDKLAAVIEQQKVTVFFITTALFNTLADLKLESLKKIRKVLFGGERASLPHVRKAFNYLGAGKMIHVYGPTESTVFATYFPIDGLDGRPGSVPIGKPIANTSIYIVDHSDNIQPIGVPGELCIAGDGLAAGYFKRPDLTAEKFVSNPFVPGERMYRTGDLGKWLPDGNIEFLGRTDHQVKIRGFRIELGEIETKLLGHGLVKEAVVVARDDPRGPSKYLCAYIVPAGELAAAELKTYLGKDLPDYMIPACFVQLTKMPLNPNGKVDLKALPEPAGVADTGTVYAAPRNDIENDLANLFQEILGIDKIGIDDDFFALGGHSLKATALAAMIHKTLQAEVPLREIFKAPTVKELAEYIGQIRGNTFGAIQPVAESEYYPVSAAQKRLYILNQLEGGGTGYNIPGTLKVEGKLEPGKLTAVIRRLIHRHESFRTYFELMDGEPVRKNLPGPAL